MIKIKDCLIFLPALIFWIPFAFSFSIANKICKNREYYSWGGNKGLFGVWATYLTRASEEDWI